MYARRIADDERQSVYDSVHSSCAASSVRSRCQQLVMTLTKRTNKQVHEHSSMRTHQIMDTSRMQLEGATTEFLASAKDEGKRVNKTG